MLTLAMMTAASARFSSGGRVQWAAVAAAPVIIASNSS
jgi:hypothetical protein